MTEESMGSFIRKLREEQTMTQKELADKLFVTNSAVSKWERNLGYPEVSTLLLIAEVLDTTIEELLQGRKKRSEPNIEVKMESIEQPIHMIKKRKVNPNIFAAIFIGLSFFFLMIISINVFLNLDEGLNEALSIVPPIMTAWFSVAGLFGALPFLIFRFWNRFGDKE